MKKNPKPHFNLLPAALMTVMAAAHAQSPADTLPPALAGCANEPDGALRLSCYDREMSALATRAARAEEAPAAPAAETVPKGASAPQPMPATAVTEAPIAATAASTTAADKAPASRVSAAPVSTATAPAARAAPPATDAVASPDAAAPAQVPAVDAPGADFGLGDEGPRQFSARVSGIRTRPYGELIILLDNGQIWEQKHRDKRFSLEVGEEVTISKGAISGYRLSGNGNAVIQVQRRR